MKIDNPKAYDKISNNYSKDTVKVSDKVTLPKQGEVIKGEIVDLQQNNIKIKLSNGQIIDAKMTEAFEFFIGQKLEFFVKESGTEQMLLKPLLQEGVATTDKLIQILQNAGLSTSKENLEVVSKLIENHMPIDKETLSKVIPYTKQFNHTNVDHILFLVKNNIPVSKDNIEQLTKMMNGENKMVQNLATLSDDLSLLIKDALGSEMAKVLLKDNPISKGVYDHIQQVVSSEQALNATKEAHEPNPIKGEEKALLDTSQQIQKQTQQQSQQLHKDVPLNIVLSQKEVQVLEDEMNYILKTEMKNTKIVIENKTISEVFKEINELEISPSLKDKMKEVVATKMTYALFSKELFIKKEHLESPEKLNQFYEKLHEKVLNILEIDSNNQEGKLGSLAKEAHQIKSSIEFMSDLNQRFNYIQFPMLFEDRLLHSELYILNDKRKIKGDKGTLTALVALDMVNLGHLDIYITKADKNVTIQFYTENEEKSGLIENKLFNVHNQLGKLGFKVLGISVSKKEKTFQVVEDFLKRKEDVHEVKRFTFDMRA
ncbi:MAG: hypothetical protein CVU84_04685 [Firmicutes bacterium HGW-Firmicutes-1]|jgi:hypothetical protein|nr:MAG: hypothetical protein CVU84_04685 [Firmicutes bacterium HGW-Firmicutes-1]